MNSLLSINRIFSKTVTAFAVFIFISVFSLSSSSYADVAASGTVGTVSWKVEGSTLTIYPTDGASGEITYSVPTSYPSGGNYWPWTQYKTTIKSVEVASGVGFSTGQSAERMFYNLSNANSMKVKNLDTSACTSMYSMFSGCSGLQSLDLSNFNTGNVTSMSYMFYDCSGLQSLDLFNFNTGNVTSMYNMFSGCSGLQSLDLSNFNTGNVTSMSYMFYGCSGLQSLDLSNFNTGNVTSMYNMFYGCSGLQSLDLSNFNTGNVTDMSSMFSGCSGLQSLDLSNFNTGNVTDMRGMFSNCKKLTSLDLSMFDTSKVKYMGGSSYSDGMFSGCSGLQSLDLSNFNTGNVTSMYNMFSGCSGLQSLDLSNFNTGNVTDMRGMFSNCEKLTSLGLSMFDTSKVKYMGGSSHSDGMFSGCSGLQSLDLSNFNTGNVTSMYNMFYGCSGLQSLDLSNFNTGNVTDMRGMFSNCEKLTSLGLSMFDTSKVKYMGGSSHSDGMFSGCSGLQSLDLSNFNTGNVTSMYNMFSGCSGLQSLDLSNFNTGNVTDMRGMFSNCKKLTSLGLSMFDTSKVNYMGGSSYSDGMFSGCSGLQSLDLSNFNTGNVTSMSYMFSNCSGLQSLDLSNFNTGNVTSMSSMFYGCSGLQSLDLSNFNTGNVTDMRGMFSNCKKLTSLDLSNFNTGNVTSMYNMFSGCSGLQSLDLSNFNTGNVTLMSYMFSGCSGLTKIKVGSNYTFSKLSSSGKYGTYGIPDSPTDTGTKAGEYSGRWTKGTKYNHTDTLSRSELLQKYSANYASSTNELVKTGPEDATWYWEVNGDDPTLNDSVSISANWVGKKPVTKSNASETDTGKTASDYAKDTNDGSGYWTKLDDNTWSYTFNVYDNSMPLYVWEEPVEGYTGDHVASSTDPDAASSPLFIAKGTDDAVITNRLNKDTGTLTITKNVVEHDGTEVEDTSRSFTFTITLADADNKAVTGDAVYGETAFHDGKADVSLTDNGTITFKDIPAGWHYTVTEDTPDGYECTCENEKGTITKDATVTAAFVNRKPDENIPVNGFMITKEASGWYQTLPDGFPFTVMLRGLSGDTEYTYTLDGANETFTSDADGDAAVELSIGNGGKAVFTGLPVGASYKVSEDGSSGYEASYRITDRNGLGLIDTDAGTAVKGSGLETAFETVDENEDITVAFDNRIQKTEDLTVGKIVDPAPSSSDSFKITVDFSNIPSDCAGFDSTAGRIVNDSGEAEAELRLQNGDTVTFTGIPVGTKYTVFEDPTNYTASYTVTDKNGGSSIVKASDTATGPAVKLSTEQETVDEGEDAEVIFTNRYNTNFAVQKTDEDGTCLANAEFKLWRYDADEKKWVDTWRRYTAGNDGALTYEETSDPAVTDGNGYIYFESVPAGRYVLEEVKPPAWFLIRSLRIIYISGMDGKVYYKDDGNAFRNALTIAASEMTEWPVEKTMEFGNEAETGEWNFMISRSSREFPPETGDAGTVKQLMGTMNSYQITDERNIISVLPETGAGGIAVFIIAGAICFAGYVAVKRRENRNAA